MGKQDAGHVKPRRARKASASMRFVEVQPSRKKTVVCDAKALPIQPRQGAVRGMAVIDPWSVRIDGKSVDRGVIVKDGRRH